MSGISSSSGPKPASDCKTRGGGLYLKVCLQKARGGKMGFLERRKEEDTPSFRESLGGSERSLHTTRTGEPQQPPPLLGDPAAETGLACDLMLLGGPFGSWRRTLQSIRYGTAKGAVSTCGTYAGSIMCAHFLQRLQKSPIACAWAPAFNPVRYGCIF